MPPGQTYPAKTPIVAQQSKAFATAYQAFLAKQPGTSPLGKSDAVPQGGCPQSASFQPWGGNGNEGINGQARRNPAETRIVAQRSKEYLAPPTNTETVTQGATPPTGTIPIT